MPLPLLAWLGIAAAGQAGASLFGAHKGAKAAEKASKQQQAAAQQAIRYQEPLYQQALQIAQQQAAQGQARYAPYAQTGGQGLVALSSLLGLPAPRIPAETTIPAPVAPPSAASAPAAAFPRPSNAQMRAIQQATGMSAEMARQSGFTGGPTGSEFVLLRAPTGQTRAVPPDQVAHYLARGATRV